MVKAELLVHFSYNVKCTESANFVKFDSEKELAKVAKTEKKYKLKMLCWHGVAAVSSLLFKVNI
jgi:hypothetical protein